MKGQEKGIAKMTNDISSYKNLPVIHWENQKRQLIIPLNESNLSSRS